MASVSKPNRRIPLETMTRIWDRARRLTSDPAIGIKTARFVRPTTFGALTLAFYASPSPEAALNNVSLYGRIFSDAGLWILREKNDQHELLMMARNRLSVNVVDAGCASIVQLVRDITSPEYNPMEITLSRPEPENKQPWDSFFRCPIHYHPGVPSMILFSFSHLPLPLPGYDPEIYQQSLAMINSKMAALNQSEITSLVRAQIMRNLHEGSVRIENIAKELNMGVRTLQRTLESEGYTYRDILDGIRSDLASRYIAQTGMSYTNLAGLLGFSSLASFSRAFHRWHGVAPSDYLKEDYRDKLSEAE